MPTRQGAPWASVGGRLLQVEAWVDHDAVMDSWERLAAALGLLARTHDLPLAVEVGEAGRRPRFANHLEPADVLARAGGNGPDPGLGGRPAGAAGTAGMTPSPGPAR